MLPGAKEMHLTPLTSPTQNEKKKFEMPDLLEVGKIFPMFL